MAARIAGMDLPRIVPDVLQQSGHWREAAWEPLVCSVSRGEASVATWRWVRQADGLDLRRISHGVFAMDMPATALITEGWVMRKNPWVAALCVYFWACSQALGAGMSPDFTGRW